MKPIVIVTTRPFDWMIDQLAARYDLHVLDAGQDLSDLPDRARMARGIARFANGRVDRSLIAALPELRVVANFGAGYELVDMQAARERDISVSYNGSGSPNAVADHAIALLLGVTRQVVDAHRFVASGDWLHARYPLVEGFSGRRLGIYGMGRIGQAIARRAIPFEMEIGYHNRRKIEGSAHRHFDNLGELADWSEHMVIACPATPETVGSVDEAIIGRLGPKGVLINIARGSVIDQNALVAALDAGRIGGAGLDVLVVEPSLPHGLVGRPNVVLTPHIAGSTLDGWRAATQQMIDNLDNYFETGRVLEPVSASA